MSSGACSPSKPSAVGVMAATYDLMTDVLSLAEELQDRVCGTPIKPDAIGPVQDGIVGQLVAQQRIVSATRDALREVLTELYGG